MFSTNLGITSVLFGCQRSMSIHFEAYGISKKMSIVQKITDHWLKIDRLNKKRHQFSGTPCMKMAYKMMLPVCMPNI